MDASRCNRRRLGISLLLVLVSGATSAAEPTPTQAAGDRPLPSLQLDHYPLSLSEAAPGAGEATPAPPTLRPLTASEVNAVLAGLPEIPVAEPDRFALPEQQLPRPQLLADPSSLTAPQTRPAAESAGPLRLLRHYPQGSIDQANSIRAVFDRPMVALGAQQQALTELPVYLRPAVPGHWHWLDPTTLAFQPEAQRLPMATHFEVTLDSAIQSADGSQLAAEQQWTFETPTLAIVAAYPAQREQVGAKPLIFLSFNQRINAKQLLPSLSLWAGKRRFGLRLADTQDQAKSSISGLAMLASRTPPGQGIALEVVGRLPLDEDFELRLAPGAPSAEGPRLSKALQQHRFSTYGPLRANLVCGQRRSRCAIEEGLEILFSNKIENAYSVLPTRVRITPAIPKMHLFALGDTLRISGDLADDTRYRIDLLPGIVDVYGQPLRAQTLYAYTQSPVPTFVLSDRPLTTVPSSRPRLPIHSRNLAALDVSLRTVQATDWPAYLALRGQFADPFAKPGEPPGQEIARFPLPTGADSSVHSQTELDLAPYLDAHGQGQLLVLLSGGEAVSGNAAGGLVQREMAWVQVTDLALQATSDGRILQVWVTDLELGTPQAGITLNWAGREAEGVRTDDRGLARLPLLPAPGSTLLTASLGPRQALLNYTDWRGEAWQRSEASDLRWLLVPDRQLYRPGERVHASGWVRQIATEDGRLLWPPSGQIDYQVTDESGSSIASGTAKTTSPGNFHLAFDLPQTLDLGYATIALTLDQAHKEIHLIEIDAYRKPEFELRLQAPAGPLSAGEAIRIDLQAAYFSGGSMPDSEVLWSANANLDHFVPPGLDADWTFGDEAAAWGYGDYDNEGADEIESRTDAQGRHSLNLIAEANGVPLPLWIGVSAEVEDLNGQAIASDLELLVHPALAYVGLRTRSAFVATGQPVEVEFVVVDPEGQPLPGHTVEFHAGIPALRLFSKDDSEPGEHELRRVQTCTVRSDASGRASCLLLPAEPGDWSLTALTRDSEGRANLSRMNLWVNGDLGSTGDVDDAELQLIADADRYEPGATARVLVLAPFASGSGLLRLHREQLLEELPFQLSNGQAELQIPLRDAWFPGVQLHAVVIEGAEAGALPRQSSGTGLLPMAPTLVQLQVTAQALPAIAEPGGTVRIDLQVSDSHARPLADARLSLVAIDEGVLSLRQGSSMEFLSALYPGLEDEFELGIAEGREGAVELDINESERLMLRRAQSLLSAARNGRFDGYDDALTAVQVTGSRIQAQRIQPDDEASAGDVLLRRDFNPLAAFLPDLKTDRDGRVSADIQLPDNLTRYRIVAYASLGPDRFGLGRSTLTARLPLMARPSPPRFLHSGDRFDLPVLVQNLSDDPMTVQVAAKAAGLSLHGPRGYALELPAQQRALLSFPASVDNAGQAQVMVAARSKGLGDAAASLIPVWTKASVERYARYGVLDAGGVEQALQLPSEVWPDQGGLQLELSTTALQSLQDAYRYLQDYPYACTEQVASRVLATVALGPVLGAFGRGPDPAEIEAALARDLNLLLERRSWTGFGLWEYGKLELPYVGLHAIHALLRAGKAGYPVAGFDERKALELLEHISDVASERYDATSRMHLAAYVEYLRSLAGKTDPRSVRQLLARSDAQSTLTPEALGWLLAALADVPGTESEREQLAARLQNLLEETAAGARLRSEWFGGQHLLLRSDGTADAIYLDALLATDPESSLIPKLVAGLEQQRRAGHWGNTHQNAFVLLALQRYFQTFEALDPDLLARVWLGPAFVGEQRLSGRDLVSHRWQIPLDLLADRDSLALSREGQGRLYYRVGLEYYPKGDGQQPLDRGFAVQRRYLAVDDDADVQRAADGSWQIRAGARVRVELSMRNPAQRYHVALIDPLPAGLEAQNPTHATVRTDAHAPHAWWVDHQNQRDERVEAFAVELSPGEREYSYIARATTVGEFTAPPARAEEMYAPESFGRSASDRVRVVARD